MMLVSSRVLGPLSRKSCIEWCSVCSASSSSVSVAWNSNGCANSEVSERVLDRWVVREDAVQRGELQDHAHLLVRRRESQVAPAAANQLECGDHRAQARAVDEADAFQVDDQTWRAVFDRIADRLFKRGRAGYVEPARWNHDCHPCLGLTRLNVQAHGSTAYNAGKA